jgi:transcriptional antiterminator
MLFNQNFLTKQQIASHLDISPKTLYRRLKKYEIPYDGELIPLEKAKNIVDILTKSPQKDSNTHMDHRP